MLQAMKRTKAAPASLRPTNRKGTSSKRTATPVIAAIAHVAAPKPNPKANPAAGPNPSAAATRKETTKAGPGLIAAATGVNMDQAGERVYQTVSRIMSVATQYGKPPHVVARKMAERRIDLIGSLVHV